MRSDTPPNLAELKALLIQIEDLTGKLEYIAADIFWKQPKYVDPFLKIAHRINDMTQAGHLKSHNVKTALWHLCQDNGFYPIRLPKKQMIFVHWNQLIDIRDALAGIYGAEQKMKKAEAEKADQAENNAVNLIGINPTQNADQTV